MDTSLVAALGLGFLLGLRHAMEADHVAAVSTFVAMPRFYGTRADPSLGCWNRAVFERSGGGLRVDDLADDGHTVAREAAAPGVDGRGFHRRWGGWRANRRRVATARHRPD